jgi:hypothetical protein
MRRPVSWLSIVAFSAMPTFAMQEAGTPESGVATGVRQVEQGDYAGAVKSLEPAIARLRGDPARVRLLVQANIQLAIAHVALDHTAQAVQAFSEVLTLDPDLRLDEERFSPKVLSALQAAREQAARRTGAPVRKSSSGGKAAIIGGVAVVAAGATVLAVRGGGGDPLPTFSGARFGTPARTCENGSHNLRLPFTVLVEAANPSENPVAITTVSTAVTIEASPGFPGEVGFRSGEASTVIPSSIPAKQNVTLEVTSSLICGNGEGDPGRFNEWSGIVTFTTPAGVFMVATADRMRVNLP